MYQDQEIEQESNLQEDKKVSEKKKFSIKSSKYLWIALSVSVFFLLLILLGLIVFFPANSKEDKFIEVNKTNPMGEELKDVLPSEEKKQDESIFSTDDKIINIIKVDESGAINIEEKKDIVEPKPIIVETKPIIQPAPYTPKTVTPTVQPKKTGTNSVVKTVKYYIQVGAFEKLTLAEMAKSFWVNKGLNTIIETRTADGKTMYRVKIGTFASKSEADSYLKKIKLEKGFENSFVVQMR